MLVVEDEPLIAMIIEDAVEALGCEMVGPFADLGSAFEGATSQVFDCAILDVNIRGGLSYPVATYLIDHGYPILLATGYQGSSLPELLAVQQCLAKPYSSAQLEHALRRLCDRVSRRH
ncbi:response regulator [Sphingomonas qilianensis]|uniref:response regulator n=1 Tax=Sphingomonas qilianensis TaxID=1736690 RepID=UPI0031F58380